MSEAAAERQPFARDPQYRDGMRGEPILPSSIPTPIMAKHPVDGKVEAAFIVKRSTVHPPTLFPESDSRESTRQSATENSRAAAAPNYRIACQDNLEFMATLADRSIQLTVTSPPYNIGKNYESKTSMGTYLERMERVIAECVRIMAPGGSLCWQVGNHVDRGEVVPLDIITYPLFQRHGLKLRNRIVWTFGHGLHCARRFSGRHETILWFTQSDGYTFHLDPVRIPSKYPGKKYFKGPRQGQPSCNPLEKNPGDVWDIPNVKSNHVEKTLHPCQFPVELVERLVLSLTDPGDHVLDPFMGVGSSVVAALRHDRVGFGCDISEEYIAVAHARIDSWKAGQLRVRPMNRPVYDPNLPKGGH